MTNDEKAAWLDQYNRHLAAGGKLERLMRGAWTKNTDGHPNWMSSPDCWRIVPLPRKAVIRVAYRWDESGLRTYTVRTEELSQSYLNSGWKIKEIEVSDE